MNINESKSPSRGFPLIRTISPLKRKMLLWVCSLIIGLVFIVFFVGIYRALRPSLYKSRALDTLESADDLRDSGDFTNAALSYEAAFRLAAKADWSDGKLLSIYGFARIAYDRKNYAAAETRFHEGLSLSRALGRSNFTADFHGYLGHICSMNGRPDEAEQHYRDAINGYAAMGGHDETLAGAHLVLGKLLLSQGDLSDAEENFQSAIRIYEHLGEAKRLGETHERIAELYQSYPHAAHARDHWVRAFENFTSASAAQDVLRVKVSLDSLVEQNPTAVPSAP